MLQSDDFRALSVQSLQSILLRVCPSTENPTTFTEQNLPHLSASSPFECALNLLFEEAMRTESSDCALLVFGSGYIMSEARIALGIMEPE